MSDFPEATMVEFIRYNNWANRQLLDLCAQLSADDLEASMPGAYGTILDTLAHIIRAESWYLSLFTGSRPAPSFRWEERPGVAEMTAYAVQIGDLLEDTILHLDPTTNVHEEQGDETYDYHARAILIQIIEHGIEHRTNITTILSAQERELPELDGWGYMFAHQDRFAYRES